MKKLQLLLALFALSAVIAFSQEWEKSTDFIGLDSYCTLGGNYIGTSNGVIQYISYKSEWKHLGLNGRKVYALYHETTSSNDTLIAGTDKGIYISPDKGASWILTNSPQGRCNSIELRKPNWYQRVLYACFENGLYYADNDLSDWKYLGMQGENLNNFVELASDTVGVFATKKGLVFFGENYPLTNKTANPELYITEVVDMANYWSGSYNDAPVSFLVTPNALFTTNKDSLYKSKTNNYEWVKKWTAPTGVTLNCIYMHTNGTFQLGTNQGVYLSSDKGNTITKYGNINSPVTSIHFPIYFGNQDYYYTTLGGGFYKNTSLLGYSNMQVLRLAPDGSLWVGTNGYGVFYAAGRYANWENRNTGLNNLDIRDIQFISNGDMYLATKGGAYLSTDKGMSWTAIKPFDVAMFSIMEAHPNDGITVFGSGNSVFYRLQSTFNWNGGVNNLTSDIYVIRYHPKMNKYLAAGKQGMWWSDTDFVSWFKMSAFPYTAVYDLEIEKDGRILAVTGSAIYYSDNNGAEWQTTTNIPKNYKNDITLDAGGNYYVATDGGVYYSTDRGATWIELNTGLPNLPYSAHIKCLTLDKNNHLWAGSKITGLFRTTEPVYSPTGLSSSGSETNLPVHYDPIAGILQLTLSNSEALSSTIRLYSVSGSSLLSEKVSQVAENKQKLLLPAKLSGVYILSVESSEGRRTRKVVL